MGDRGIREKSFARDNQSVHSTPGACGSMQDCQFASGERTSRFVIGMAFDFENDQNPIW